MDYEFEEIETAKPKSWWKPVAVAAGLCFVCAEVWATAAVAIDEDSGISGHGIAATRNAAQTAAIADAATNGAANPVNWFWHKGPGWGAISFSDEGGGAWSIGASIAYKKKRRAKKVAKKECKNSGGTNCQFVDLWHDDFTSKDGEAAGGPRSFHLTSK